MHELSRTVLQIHTSSYQNMLRGLYTFCGTQLALCCIYVHNQEKYSLKQDENVKCFSNVHNRYIGSAELSILHLSGAIPGLQSICWVYYVCCHRDLKLRLWIVQPRAVMESRLRIRDRDQDLTIQEPLKSVSLFSLFHQRETNRFTIFDMNYGSVEGNIYISPFIFLLI